MVCQSSLAGQLSSGGENVVCSDSVPCRDVARPQQWIEAAAKALHLSIQVVSLDDFYFEAERLDAAMRGNPWGVPRALPGSHDLPLLQDCLQRWRQREDVLVPCFDKAKRQGRGDRSGWRRCNADLLIFEGWFVGCRSSNATADEPHLEIALTPQELGGARDCNRCSPTNPPGRVHQLWQCRATDFNAPAVEINRKPLFRRKELPLPMPSWKIHSHDSHSLPSSSFQTMQANVVVEVDPDRTLRQITSPVRFRIRRLQTHSLVNKTLGAATRHRLADGGALGGNGCLGLPGGAALVALGLGCFLLRDGHCAC